MISISHLVGWRRSLPLALSFFNILIQLVAVLFYIIYFNLSQANHFNSAIKFLDFSHFLNFLSGHGTVVFDQSINSSLNISKSSGFVSLIHLDLSKNFCSELFVLCNEQFFCFFIIIENSLCLYWFL